MTLEKCPLEDDCKLEKEEWEWMERCLPNHEKCWRYQQEFTMKKRRPAQWREKYDREHGKS